MSRVKIRVVSSCLHGGFFINRDGGDRPFWKFWKSKVIVQICVVHGYFWGVELIDDVYLTIQSQGFLKQDGCRRPCWKFEKSKIIVQICIIHVEWLFLGCRIHWWCPFYHSISGFFKSRWRPSAMLKIEKIQNHSSDLCNTYL